MTLALNIHSCIGHMISKATYGEQIWREMGEDLGRWNREAMDIIGESLFSFWLVDVFHFRECSLLVLIYLGLTCIQTVRFIPDWIPGLRFKFEFSCHYYLDSYTNVLIIGKLLRRVMTWPRKYDTGSITEVWTFGYVSLPLSIIFLLYKSTYETLKKSGKLEPCILRELLEAYGPNVDVQDASATLCTGMFPVCKSLVYS
jgi:hypothetical protein